MVAGISERAKQIHADLVALRRSLHREPEVGLHLPSTQAKVLDALHGLPLVTSRGTACDSVTAVLRGAHHGPTVLLRADMDALPLQEASGVDYASLIPGRMHACGHDLHTAGLVGAARLLSEHRENLHGQVIFMFQPGEEGHHGAELMLEQGVLTAAGQPADYAFALHVSAGWLPHGVVAAKPGQANSASARFAVTVHGRGGHGAFPHTALDPVPILCEIVLAIQNFVTRRFDVFDPVIVTIGRIEAGTAPNVVAETARFEATVRCFSEVNRQRLQDELPALAAGIATAHGARADCEYTTGYPVLINEPAQTAAALDIARHLLGPDMVVEHTTPGTASEDFAYILQRVPGTMLNLGASPPGTDLTTTAGNHSPHAIFDDSVLWRQAALLTALALSKLTG